MFKKDNKSINLRTHLSPFNVINKRLLILICMNIYIIKFIVCTSFVKDASLNTLDLYSECLKCLNAKKGVKLDENVIKKLLQDYMNHQKFPIKVHTRVWSRPKIPINECEGLILIGFEIDESGTLEKDNKYPSNINENFIFDPFDNSLHIFQMGMPYFKKFIVKFKGKSKIFDFESTFAKESYLNPAKKIKESDKNDNIIMIPDFEGLRFFIVAIRPPNIGNNADTSSLYGKISNHYQYNGEWAVYKENEVFYFITVKHSMLIKRHNPIGMKIIRSIEDEYKDISKFLRSLEIHCGDAGGTLLFNILYQITNIEGGNEGYSRDNPNYALEKALYPKHRYRIIFYYGNKYYYPSQEVENTSDEIKLVEEMKKEETKSIVQSSINDNILRLNTEMNFTFNNRDGFYKGVKDWYAFMCEKKQSWGVLATEYYILYQKNKMLKLSFLFEEVMNTNGRFENICMIEFISLINIFSRTGEEFQEEMKEYCKIYIEMKDLFNEILTLMENIKSFEEFRNSKLKIIKNSKEKIEKLISILLHTFPNTISQISSDEFLDFTFHTLTEYRKKMGITGNESVKSPISPHFLSRIYLKFLKRFIFQRKKN